MDADEQAIIDYLKSWPGQFVAGREIGRRAGGKWRYRDNPAWAGSVLPRMVEKGMLESDSTGHYRLVRSSGKNSKVKQWVSPQMRKILEQSGKDFGEVLAPEDQDDFYTNH
jgi:hypothetical protein